MTEAFTSLKVAATEVAAALARRIVFLAAIALLALTAFGFALMAGWAALAEVYGDIFASLIVAAVLSAIMAVCLSADAILRRRRRKRQLRRAAAARDPVAPLLLQTFLTALQTGRSLGASQR